MYRLLAEKAGRVVAAGHSAIVDAVFARASERDAIATAAQDANVGFHPLFLVADVETRIARVGARTLMHPMPMSASCGSRKAMT